MDLATSTKNKIDTNIEESVGRFERKLAQRYDLETTLKRYVYKPTRCTEFLWLDLIFY